MGSRGRGISTASGPFSGGFAGSSRPSGGGLGGGSGGGFYSGGGGRSLKSDGKDFGQADASRSRETRINSDKLHAMTPAEELDSEDEVTMTALKDQAAGTLPMGLCRIKHKEKGVVVATTAELAAAENANDEEESLWVDEGGSVQPAQQAEEGVWNAKADKKLPLKTEPGLDDAMDLDPDSKQARGEGKKPALERQLKKQVVQDTEEETIQKDMQLLANELGAVTVTEDGETRVEGPANKDGRMYLFQFPPLLPPLKQTSCTQTKVKEERGSFDRLDTAPVDLTREEAGQRARGEAAAVAVEDDEEEDEEEAAGGFRSQLLSQGGMIGKLNVRRSGKVELDWGGTKLEMSPAVGMNFLTTAVIVEENDEKAQGGEAGGYGGDAVGMGKIMGRFILATIWSDEEEWNVAPEDLVVE
ncbi:hypothetical protein G6O67_003803 [Ophiocordyceps sinensis]|uniref:RNA polymerase III Rpc4 n=1 Tax=Ophiocordyceps sinensis TaxID=72228 RepID=A0A8H4PSQ8_9HYPO|nr:hypothetical protein G6O67_003803 [Ophiocordyceps sinensis]